MGEIPRRRWHEAPTGQAAAEQIRRVTTDAAQAMNAGDFDLALRILTTWKNGVNTAALSREALHSIEAAIQDAQEAIAHSNPDDARAYVQAVVAMLPARSP